MSLLWTSQPGDCVHGEPAAECPICHPHHSRLDDGGLVLLVLIIAAIAVFGRGSWDRETAFEDAQRREHIERLEQQQPGATQRLPDIAAEQRR